MWRFWTTLLFTCFLFHTANAFDLDETTYTNQKLGIKISAPEGWLVTSQTGYPNILALFLSPHKDATISLAIGELKPKEKFSAFVAKNNMGLQKLGFDVYDSKKTTNEPQIAWKTAARSNQSKSELQQYYLIHGQRIFIFSLSCQRNAMGKYLKELRTVVELGFAQK